MSTPVKVTDIDMKFTSMVLFMVKWSIASIPAFLILSVIGATVVTTFTLLLVALGVAGTALH